eukprot:gene5839-6080_t
MAAEKCNRSTLSAWIPQTLLFKKDSTLSVLPQPVTAHTTPLLLGAMRLLPAGLALVAWSLANGRPQPKSAAAWAWVLAFALVDGAAFQGFLAEGLERTSAGLGSVIIDSQPLTVAVLAALLFGEALSGVGVAGLLIGVVGLLLLEVPQDVLAQILVIKNTSAYMLWHFISNCIVE